MFGDKMIPLSCFNEETRRLQVESGLEYWEALVKLKLKKLDAAETVVSGSILKSPNLRNSSGVMIIKEEGKSPK